MLSQIPIPRYPSGAASWTKVRTLQNRSVGENHMAPPPLLGRRARSGSHSSGSCTISSSRFSSASSSPISLRSSSVRTSVESICSSHLIFVPPRPRHLRVEFLFSPKQKRNSSGNEGRGGQRADRSINLSFFCPRRDRKVYDRRSACSRAAGRVSFPQKRKRTAIGEATVGPEGRFTCPTGNPDHASASGSPQKKPHQEHRRSRTRTPDGKSPSPKTRREPHRGHNLLSSSPLITA